MKHLLSLKACAFYTPKSTPLKSEGHFQNMTRIIAPAVTTGRSESSKISVVVLDKF